MRLAPVPLFYAAHRAEAIARAGESSMTTHASPDARDACRLMAALIVGALQGRDKEELLRSTFFESFVESVIPLSPALRKSRPARSLASSLGDPRHRLRGRVPRGRTWPLRIRPRFEEALWPSISATMRTRRARCSVNCRRLLRGLAIPAEWRARLAHLEVIEGFAARLFAKAIAPTGPRKHVLDPTSGASVGRLNEMLSTIGARIPARPRSGPLGYRQPDEHFEDFVGLCGLIVTSPARSGRRPTPWVIRGICRVARRGRASGLFSSTRRRAAPTYRQRRSGGGRCYFVASQTQCRSAVPRLHRRRFFPIPSIRRPSSRRSAIIRKSSSRRRR